MKSDFQAEIRQNRPFGSLEEEAFLALQRTADQLQGKVSEWLKEYGLSPTQYNALRILRGAGDSGLPCSEIAERMMTTLVEQPAKISGAIAKFSSTFESSLGIN